MASSGHYLATMAGIRILESGGNAADAGAAMGMALNVLLPEMCNLGGVAPVLLYERDRQEVWQISGLGSYPSRVSIDWFNTEHGGRILGGPGGTVTPAALGAWVTAVLRFGVKTFAEVAAPAIELAANGFPMHWSLAPKSQAIADAPDAHQSKVDVFAPGGKPIRVGEPVVQSDLAGSLERLAAVESSEPGDRTRGLQAVLDEFYRGEMAREMAEFNQSVGGLMTAEDLAGHRNRVEPAISTTYRGHRVFACGPWCQGPAVLQALNILEGYDFGPWPHNGVEHLHHVAQALNAALSDRHSYYGDPLFVNVPMQGLLSKEYAAVWRERIDPNAFTEMPAPGNPWSHQGGQAGPARPAAPVIEAPIPPDTSYLCVVDEQGNAMSATPSDGAAGPGGQPFTPGLGFPISTRGTQGWLDPDHPSAVAPGKRPRLTPNPGLMIWDDGRVMPYGTPGGDVQTQAMTQLVVNLVDYDMHPQEAVEAPRVWSENFPGSWDPHPYSPGVLQVETRIDANTLDGLRDRGHVIKEWSDWEHTHTGVCVCRADLTARIYEGAADPRRLCYAIGW